MTKLTENQTAVLTNYSFEGGRWFDSVAGDLVTLGIIAKKQQAKVTLNQLIKKGLMTVDTTVEEGSSWITLSTLGQEIAADFAPVEAEEDDLLGDVEEALQDVLEGTPADEVEEALAEIEAEEVVHAVTATETYTATEWTDEKDVEWIETIFLDGSKTLKRRQKVSGSWRTDYWGTEAGAEKQVFTTAKAAKMARAYGTFNPLV